MKRFDIYKTTGGTYSTKPRPTVIIQALAFDNYEKTQAGIKLMIGLAKGRKSGEEQGWESIESVEAALGIQ